MSTKDSNIYLSDILHAIGKIEQYTQDGKRFFMKDGKTQDAVVQNLTVIGEAVKKIPKSITKKAPDIPWKHIAGMRDILIHDYSITDMETVWNTVRGDLPILQKTIERLMQQ